MPAVTRAQVRFRDLDGKPIASEEGRIYIFSQRGNLRPQDAHVAFSPWSTEAQTTKSGAFVQILNATKFKEANAITLTRTDPAGAWTHLAVFSDKPMSADYLTKHWEKVRSLGAVICDLTKGDKAYDRCKADGTGDWIAKIDTKGTPFGPEGKCDVIALTLGDAEGKSIERRPSKDGVLQIVPPPGFTLAIPIFGSDALKEAGEATDLMKAWQKKKKDSPRKTFRAWSKEQASKIQSDAKKERKEKLKKGETFEKGLEVQASFSSGGSTLVYPRFECANEKCKKTGTHTITGGTYSKTAVDPKAGVKVKHGGIFDPLKWNVHTPPTKYTIEGKGCSGPSKQLTVEVFPATQALVDVKWSLEYLGTKFDKVNKYFGDLNKKGSVKGKGVEFAGFKFEMDGGFKYMTGWKEKEADWRVAWVSVVGAEFAATLGFPSLSISAMQLGFGIPQTITDYIGDIRLSIGAEGKFSVGGEVELESKEPFGSIESWAGKVEVKLAVYLPIELKGFIGKEGALGASISASFKPGLYGLGELTRNAEGKKTLELSAGLEPAEIECTVKLDVVITSYSTQLGKVKCWDKIEFGKLGPWPIGE